MRSARRLWDKRACGRERETWVNVCPTFPPTPLAKLDRVNPAVPPPQQSAPARLDRYIWLSVGAALATFGIKAVAAWMTNSVGMWSDALETVTNIVAAFIALWAIRLASRPADHNHNFGHGKAEYISAAIEGVMIFAAAAAILISAIQRLVHPEPLESLGWGLVLLVAAMLINLTVALVLILAGRKHRSITLEADGKHLLTDVLTSIGVLAAIGLVALTGWTVLDPIIAIAVAVNILFTGWRLVHRAGVGLLDGTLPPDEVATITEVLDRVAGDPQVNITELRTRESGRQRFVYATVTVPGEWTVRRSHDVADQVEAIVDETFAGTTTFVHIEPAD